jgi:hypothetical protein
MHHLIYPQKDTFITNKTNYSGRNFGLDEILQVGVNTVNVVETLSTTTYVYPSSSVILLDVDQFTGAVTGSFKGGTVVEANGDIIGTVAVFTASFFSGDLTASIDGVPFTGSTTTGSGAISASFISGSVLSSITVPCDYGVFETFTGNFISASGLITGWISGSEIKNKQRVDVTAKRFIDRALLKFDITAISSSISSGGIVNPKFSLKLKTYKAEELPLSYTVYAYPVSQSWDMGNGYYSDGGSESGTNWYYRNNNNDVFWFVPTTQSLNNIVGDYLANDTYATESFKYGGSTWYYSGSSGEVLKCTQSFGYEASDVNMDVTPIVMAWLSGSVPNEGFILMHSDETTSTSSYATLKFYSRDTNTIYAPRLDVKWDDSSYITGSNYTASVTMQYTQSGINGVANSGSTFSINGGFSGAWEAFTMLVKVDQDGTQSFSGFTNGTGSSGNVNDLSISGNITGSWTGSTVVGTCGKVFDTTILSGSFSSGFWSGSNFSGYYDNGLIWNGFITGSWTPSQVLGATVNIPIPSGIDPYAYAYVTGGFVNGTALGLYNIFDNTSASFDGQFISGPLAGGMMFVQITGSAYTSSFYTTGSVEISSSGISPLNIDSSFTVVVKNILSTYKAGDIVKFGVFGRSAFPLKNFTRATQPTPYLVPEYLPTSSYYAIKDNETEEILVGFDNYTKVSCEYPRGNFFMLDTTGLPQERRFRLLIRVESGSAIYTFDHGDIFKITR